MNKPNDFYAFDCGCKFPITDEPFLENLNRPSIDFDPENIPVNCWKTWHLISAGHTRGLFQLESRLGQKWAKELKPEKMEHLSALGAILRPGSLHSLDKEGVSSTKHYCLRKNGQEPVTYQHECLKEVLEKTYGQNIYQESSMSIARIIASFTLQEADTLRKNLGKKDAFGMAKSKKMFMERAKAVGIVDEAKAQEIFVSIEEAQRYAFNKTLTLDTVVDTLNGPKTIEEINIGDSVNSPYGVIKVLDKFDHGIQKIYQVTLESQKYIQCSIGHKFLCEDNQVRPLWDIITNNIKIVCENNKSEAVVDLKEIGELPTMDIEVDHPSHIFYGNGIATSNSHSYAYAKHTYLSAYIKAHFLTEFYTAWLSFAKDRQNNGGPREEMAAIVNEAKVLNVDVYPPDIRNLEPNFYITNPTTIRFGMGNVKGLGAANVKKTKETLESLQEGFKPLKDWTWYEFLCLAGPQLSRTAVLPLLMVGAFRHLHVSRKVLCEEYKQFKEVFDTAGELKWLASNWNNATSLADLLALRSQCIQDELDEYLAKPRKEAKKPVKITKEERLKTAVATLQSVEQMLRKPPSSMEDDPNEIAVNEEALMGIALTCSKADGKIGEQSNITCKEFLDGKNSSYMIFKVQIDEVHEYKIPAGKGKEENVGKTMAFVRMSDGTCKLDNVVIYPTEYEGWEADEENNVEAFEGYRGVLTPGRILEVRCERPWKKEGLSIKQIWEL